MDVFDISPVPTTDTFISESSVITFSDQIDRTESKVMTLPRIFDFLNATIAAVGIVGNSMVIPVVCKMMKKNMPNLFIAAQSSADVLVGVVLIGVTFFRMEGSLPSGLAGEVFCRAWLSNGVLWSMIYVSVYNMIAMTWERYIAIIFPIWHAKHVSRRKALIVIAVVWVVVFWLAMTHPVWSSKVRNGDCEVYAHWGSHENTVIFAVWTLFFLYVIPLTTIVCTYSHIWWVLKRSSPSGLDGGSAESQASEGREKAIKSARYNVIRLCLYVNISYVFCFTMNVIFYTSASLGVHTGQINFQSISYHLSVVIVFVNSCMYPFVYLFKYAEYQESLKKIICPRSVKKDKLNASSVNFGSRAESSTCVTKM